MDMSKDEPSVYVAMQEQSDTIKYADIQPSPYESSYQQDIYQEQGLACALKLASFCVRFSCDECGLMRITLKVWTDLVPNILKGEAPF